MARPGRKRKSGVRTKSGRLARVVTIDRGCEGVQRRQRAFGVRALTNDNEEIVVDSSQTFDALGRAWSAGLISERFRDSGRVIAAQYWRVYGFATPDSLARFQPTTAFGLPDDEKDRIREDALNDALDAVRREGRDVARAFSQLVVDLHPDCGPAWLDRAIAARHTGRSPHEADGAMLELAVRGLKAVA